ncbi:MAG: SOS response-associated peptidase [Erysipelothrix sp.]|nr:SOS response-associated peptidase [Erysipelothrix sp.]
MCGRYLFVEKDEEMQEWIDMVTPKTTFSTDEIFPTQSALVIVKNDVVHTTAMNWGFIKWDDKGRIINARQETVASSPFFKSSFEQYRCIVLASGFYEWDTHKDRYLIRLKEQPVQYMAAVYQIKNDKQMFAILTQAAQTDFEAIHNRQPVFLKKSEVDPYLSFKISDAAILRPRTWNLDITSMRIQQRLF